jgi:hypothetical protein
MNSLKIFTFWVCFNKFSLVRIWRIHKMAKNVGKLRTSWSIMVHLEKVDPFFLYARWFGLSQNTFHATVL